MGSEFHKKAISRITPEEREANVKKLDHITAPFSEEQVKNLNEYQQLGFVHEFTCCSPEDIPECERSSEKSNGTLIATPQGWMCPCGKYSQNWAHRFMLDAEGLKKQFKEKFSK